VLDDLSEAEIFEEIALPRLTQRRSPFLVLIPKQKSLGISTEERRA
jgi:hypothetical protein